MPGSEPPSLDQDEFTAEIEAIRREADSLREGYSNFPKVMAAILPVCAALHLHKDAIFESLCEELTPEVYIDIEVYKTRLYKIVRRLLRALGKNVAQRSGLPVGKATSDILYHNNPDLHATATQRLEALRRGQDPNPPPLTPNPSILNLSGPSANPSTLHSRHPEDQSGRAASAVQQTFRDDDKFSGDMHEKVSLHVVRRRYLTAINSQKVARHQQHAAFIVLHHTAGNDELDVA